MKKGPTNVNDVQAKNPLPGIFLKTLTYNDHIMMCHFTLEAGAEIPLHQHKQSQLGFVLKGKLKFIGENREFIGKPGDSYVFDTNELHGATAIDHSEVIETFSPARDDYK